MPTSHSESGRQIRHCKSVIKRSQIHLVLRYQPCLENKHVAASDFPAAARGAASRIEFELLTNGS